MEATNNLLNSAQPPGSFAPAIEDIVQMVEKEANSHGFYVQDVFVEPEDADLEVYICGDLLKEDRSASATYFHMVASEQDEAQMKRDIAQEMKRLCQKSRVSCFA